MKHAILLFTLGLPLIAMGQTSSSPVRLKADIQLALDRGIAFLKSKQDAQGGHWVTPEEPALSALVLTAIQRDPSKISDAEAESPELRKGYAFLLKNVQPDGGIYARARANYNTAISLTALVHRGNPADEQVMRKARSYLVGSQVDADTKDSTDNIMDGGFGYGDKNRGAHADLSNTAFTLEALYLSKARFEDTAHPIDKKDDLNFGAAIQFLKRCQNLPKSNDQSWAGNDTKNIGAFAYTPAPPDESKKKDGKVPMRYYGSISYAGMMSFIYAGFTSDAPEVKAAQQWLSENYTVDENPGMGAEGLFYYYHTMAKALNAAGLDTLTTKDGTVEWKTALSRKLISLQSPEGSWQNNASGRWMESDPVLVTAYSVLALEEILNAMK